MWMARTFVAAEMSEVQHNIDVLRSWTYLTHCGSCATIPTTGLDPRQGHPSRKEMEEHNTVAMREWDQVVRGY